MRGKVDGQPYFLVVWPSDGPSTTRINADDQQRILDMQRYPRSVWIAALGVAGTIQYHSAQFFSGFDTFFGDRGDARGFVYFCEHWYQSILGQSLAA